MELNLKEFKNLSELKKYLQQRRTELMEANKINPNPAYTYFKDCLEPGAPKFDVKKFKEYINNDGMHELQEVVSMITCIEVLEKKFSTDFIKSEQERFHQIDYSDETLGTCTKEWIAYLVAYHFATIASQEIPFDQYLENTNKEIEKYNKDVIHANALNINLKKAAYELYCKFINVGYLQDLIIAYATSFDSNKKKKI